MDMHKLNIEMDFFDVSGERSKVQCEAQCGLLGGEIVLLYKKINHVVDEYNMTT
jgi:hypothetical protein